MDEKTKATMLRYRKNAREQIQIDMAKGMKAKIKAYAERRGVSMSALIMRLVEEEMNQDAAFVAEWAEHERTESERIEQERTETVSAIRAGMKPPAAHGKE